MNKPVVSIVIPVYNSCEIAPVLYMNICEALKNIPFEIILVDDGSIDSSWDIVNQFAIKDNRVTAVKLRVNYGQDNAILAGLRLAIGEYQVIMDDDLQHSPDEIPLMLEKCKEGFDVVYACFRVWKQSTVRKIGSRINGGFARWLLGKPAGLYLSPFKILKRELAAEVARFPGPYPYIDGIILSQAPRIAQVVTKHHKRYSGRSNYNIKRAAGVWFRLFSGFSVVPLRLATLAGFITAFTSFCMMSYYLYEYFFTDHIVEGWTTIVLLLFIFGGLILMVLGLIGEFIGRIYLIINGKPAYKIREIVKSGEQE